MSDTYTGICKVCKQKTDLIEGICANCFEEENKIEILKIALDKACHRIADSGQEYHEAKTKKGWVEFYKTEAEKLLDYQLLLKKGLSESEARRTIWGQE